MSILLPMSDSESNIRWRIQCRYINFACYEILLPRQKTIVLDPSISIVDSYHTACMTDEVLQQVRESFCGCDYIVVSHTHNDHISEAGYLANKFKSKVFVGACSARDLAEYQNINLSQLYPCEHGCVYRTDDFELRAYRSRHTIHRSEKTIRDIFSESADLSFLATRINGSIEYYDYFITTNDHLRILICGGYSVENSFAHLSNELSQMAPDILFCQVSRKMSPEEFARSLMVVSAPIIFPMHQDGMLKQTGCQSFTGWVAQVNEELRKESDCVMIDPGKDRYVRIGMRISL